MIRKVIEVSLKNRLLTILFGAAIMISGLFAVFNIPIDAIPDLSDTQVIIYTEYSGQAPQVVEDQVTYPLTSAMLGVPHSKVVRGYSFFGFSLVYVIFEDGTDLYWARSRVLEYLNFAAGRLPDGVKPRLGPDATGVGWVFMYTLRDKTGRHDLQKLRAIQDWTLRYELASLKGVSEVASLGGFVKQYQIEVDPSKLILHRVSIQLLRKRLSRSNRDTGGRLIEMGETEFMVRGLGYIKSVEDIRKIVLKVDREGNPVTIGDVANVQIGPEIRRGLAEFNGEGETVAGIVLIRSGENALEVIDRVKKRLKELQPSLPKGVEIVPSYDRSNLIKRAVRNVTWKVGEEMLVVALVTMLFLLHARSALVAVVVLPLGVLASLFTMYALGISVNIMSLGGIAIAIGVMVDASVVMVENLHKHLERNPDLPHLEIVRRASIEVGPALFYSLLIITISFLPVLLLEEQSGRLFRPLALTKTFAMAFAAIIAISIIPVLMSFFIKRDGPPPETPAPLPPHDEQDDEPMGIDPEGLYTSPGEAKALEHTTSTLAYRLKLLFRPLNRLRGEDENPIARFLKTIFTPLIHGALEKKMPFFLAILGIVLLTIIPLKGIPKPGGGYLVRPIGGEFMPPLNEGDLLYMPTTLPGLSITKARELLQKTDAIIKSFPEVDHVLGKIGRAQTATDPAPLTMIETTIMLKDKKHWRAGMTTEKLIRELDKAIQFPGLTNAWTYPIRTRIDMLSTGIKTPVGIKLMGDDLEKLSRFGSRVEAILKELPGTASAISERVTGGKYIDYEIDRDAAARYGLTIGDIQDTIMTAVGGMNVTTTVEGLARYPVNIRYPRELRDSLSKLRDIYVSLPNGAYIPITQVARLRVKDGPPAIKTENARKTAWIFVDLKQGKDVASYVEEAREHLSQKIAEKKLIVPPGVTILWSGQYEYLERAAKRLTIAGAAALAAIILLMYLHFRNFLQPAILLGCLAFAVTGGIWYMWVLDFNRSVATDVGFIALAGLSVETGIVLLVYLDNVFARRRSEGRLKTPADIREAMLEGVVERLRPKLMTTATTFMGLLPLMWAAEAGSRVMKRLAAPMIGGLVTDTIVTLFLIPVIYEWIQLRKLKQGKAGPLHDPAENENAA